MRHRLIALACAVCLLLIVAPLVVAQNVVSVANDRATLKFPEWVAFSADLKSSTEIKRVVLEYGVQSMACGTVVGKAFPEFTPAKSVNVQWTWEMKQTGSRPPGATIWWRWRVTDSSGKESVTPDKTIVWLDNLHTWQTIAGSQVNVHWYKGDRPFAADLQAAGERALSDLHQSTGLKNDAPTDVYLYGSSQDLRDAIYYTPNWIGGQAYAANNIVVIAIAPGQIEWGKRSIAHELSHVLFGRVAFSCLSDSTAWLHEGLAVFAEGGLDATSDQAFRTAVANNQLASVRALTGSFPEASDRANLAYSQSYSLVNFLIAEYGEARMIALTRALRDGTTIDQALQTTYGFDTEGLEDAWRAKVGAAPRPAAARLTPTPTPTPVPTIAPVKGLPVSTRTPIALSASTPTKVPSPPVFTYTPAVTLGPSRAATRTTTPTAFALKPTATRAPAGSFRSGSYSNDEWGVSLRYPTLWTSKASTQPGQLAQFTAPQNKAAAILLAGKLDASVDLEELARQLRQSVLGTMDEVAALVDQATPLGDNTPAWTIVATAKQKNGVRIKANLTVTTLGTRYFLLLSYAAVTDYDAHRSSIDEMSSSLRLRAPQRSGVARDQSLFLEGSESTNARSYDPATANGGADTRVFSGLVSFDPQLQIVPDLAESWQVTEGITYTFHLRANARFHNGRPVTAYDVVYSWERAANPKTQSDTVLTYLGDIVGVRAMKEGQADHIAGIQALDALTLQVVADAPKPYLILKLTSAPALVVDRENVESGPEWYRTPNGSGPFRLIRWDRFEQMVYERNEDYYGRLPEIRNIVVDLFAGVGLRLYEAGDIDLTGVSTGSIARVLDPQDPLHKDLVAGTSLCTNLIVFDVSQPPFDDARVRQAFALAFDRRKYVDFVMDGVGLPAQGIFPPALPGYNSAVQGTVYDPERARQLLAASKYANLATMPTIVYTTSGTGSALRTDVAAAAQMWQQTLGVTVTIENLESDRYIDEMNAGRHGQIMGMGWCADYADPENFVDLLFHTGAQNNWGHYSNPQVDTWLDQARVEQDTPRRLQLYQRAEQAILDDAAVVSVAHHLSHVLVKPYIKGFVLTPLNVPIERYLRVDPSRIP